MKTVIELKNVSKTYKMDEVEVPVLKDVSLKISEKEFVAIMGPSGSGKSTLLNMVGCLDRPSSGKIFLDGTDISTLNDSELAKLRGRKIGFVFQFFHLYPTLTAKENIELPMMIIELDKETREKRAEELLKIVGLEKRAGHLPSQLSGGERQRVAVARALANNPSLLLADEPTGNLDSKKGKEIIDLFIKLNKEGRTIVIVTHDQQIASYAKDTIKIKDGMIQR
ncbi:ABC transporter ATP-binding protein [archaeon]|nr:MAG: ABC transporter ATP-binding protein [archaeon]